MRKLVSALIVLIVLTASAFAQTGVPGQKFAWDQPAATLAEAQGYTYKYYPDSATTGVTFTAVTCTGTATPFTCEVLIPAFTPGNHSITLTASNVAGESAKSAPFAFTFVVVPGVPGNIRIK